MDWDGGLAHKRIVDTSRDEKYRARFALLWLCFGPLLFASRAGVFVGRVFLRAGGDALGGCRNGRGLWGCVDGIYPLRAHGQQEESCKYRCLYKLSQGLELGQTRVVVMRCFSKESCG